MNVELINKIKLLDIGAANESFSVLWIQAAESKNRDTQNLRYHHHAFLEIHFVLEGQICYETKDNGYAVNAGQYIVVPPHVRHRVGSLSDDFCKLTVALDINERSRFSSQKPWVSDIDGELSYVISLVSKCASEKREYSRELITLWIRAAVYGVMERSSYKLHSESTAQTLDPRFLKAKKYIEDNYDVFFSCEEIASYCRLSAKQLGRLFMEYEGMGLSDFIKKSKHEAAKRMLTSSDKSQLKISEELGFSSVSYFNKFFMKCEGISPGEYKKRQE